MVALIRGPSLLLLIGMSYIVAHTCLFRTGSGAQRGLPTPVRFVTRMSFNASFRKANIPLQVRQSSTTSVLNIPSQVRQSSTTPVPQTSPNATMTAFASGEPKSPIACGNAFGISRAYGCATDLA